MARDVDFRRWLFGYGADVVIESLNLLLMRSRWALHWPATPATVKAERIDSVHALCTRLKVYLLIERKLLLLFRSKAVVSLDYACFES